MILKGEGRKANGEGSKMQITHGDHSLTYEN